MRKGEAVRGERERVGNHQLADNKLKGGRIANPGEKIKSTAMRLDNLDTFTRPNHSLIEQVKIGGRDG